MSRSPWCPLTLVFAVVMTSLPCSPVRAAGNDGKILDGVVNLNTAPPAQLLLLPGVGPGRVRGILAYRARRPFRTVDELVRVKGIGRRMVREIRPHLAVTGPTTARAGPASFDEVRPVVQPPPPAPARPFCRPNPLPGRTAGPKPRLGIVRSGANHCARPP